MNTDRRTDGLRKYNSAPNGWERALKWNTIPCVYAPLCRAKIARLTQMLVFWIIRASYEFSKCTVQGPRYSLSG
jgi:hypothetical protein